jgi:chaperone required for assembly of F1-ATPase
MNKSIRPQSREIAALNDAARKSFSGCQVIVTQGIIALEQDAEILKRVSEFKEFTKDNDPYGEHDF